MKKSILFSGLLSAVLMGSAGATSQGGILTTSDKEIVQEQGFNLQEVLQIVSSADATIKTSFQVVDGLEVGLVEFASGNRFIMTPDACDAGTCYSLQLLTYFPLQGVSASQFDLNDFNLNAPGGSVAYFEEGNSFVSKRTITNFGGITRASLVGNLVYYRGYNNYFIQWLQDQSRLVAVSDEVAEKPSKIDNVIKPAASSYDEERTIKLLNAFDTPVEWK